MTSQKPNPSAEAWAVVEQERRRDRFVRRVSKVAWSVAFVILLLFGLVTGLQVAGIVAGYFAGTMPLIMVLGAVIPFVVVAGFLSVLIATLSTVGIFLRQRTASFAEIQLRLAALEEMLSSQGDARSSPQA
jgi:hypothetical protein